MPPTFRPLPRFIAEPPHELEPYGRWAERLAEAFLAACAAVDEAPEETSPGDIEWYPERSWCGRTYVPATAAAGEGLEFFGYVSFAREGDEPNGEPTDFRAVADFTDETAAPEPALEDRPQRRGDRLLARSRQARGDVTLVWGVPLGPEAAGSAAVTAELDGETVDQCGLGEVRRFTLVALDAVSGLAAEDLYLEVKLWGRRSEQLAVESLYEAE